MNLLDIIFPEKCIYCNKYGRYICQNCFNKLDNKYLFKKIDNDFFNYLICGTIYKNKTKIQIHNFKFHEQSYLHKYFIELILNNRSIYEFLKKFDYITYIPMTKNKKLLRGYNQAELLALELGKRLDIKVVKLLEKFKENKTQSSLLKEERVKNVQDIFEFYNEQKASLFVHKNIILIDDIFTTGSTVRSASKVLKKNNVNKICVLTISKAGI